ncbi:hypothetical protein [Lacimicrobium sp. SS2-24]|uniref:hypothetical protein n=1 Tax=Lacimicrobium sp. SS2-24 TaxID=2005569 RepID=UPI0011319C07|nr:hypothetical protein [Lacimicrobium sp. SS2-24]
MAADNVRYVDVNHILGTRNNSYFPELLNLALSKTQQEYGSYKLEAVTAPITQNRQFKEIDKGTVDVFWTMTTTAREQQAIAVPVPLMKGLYGMRLLAINRHDQSVFDTIKDLPDFNGYIALQGADWPDVTILQAAGLKVSTEVEERYRYTFLHLNQGFYYPRGLTEIFAEMERHPHADLSVERKHLFVYPAAIYFFVSHARPNLAERLTTGLNKAIADGSFDRVFFDFEGHQSWISQARLSQRTVHWMDNPLISDIPQKTRIRALQQQLLDSANRVDNRP